MKKIIFTIIFGILLMPFGYTQNQVITKMVIPERSRIALIKMKINAASNQSFPKLVYSAEPADNGLLFFNDSPVLKGNGNIKRAVLLFTELSFGDVLENSMNRLKTGLINTYDDQVTELFKDAPSLIKLKFIFSL
ncbi:MAG: hypothetical protein IPH68_11160 [Chitinophagaceae bacterium]|nr:hypothetical protein [Chitinophagaceae bacterium]